MLFDFSNVLFLSSLIPKDLEEIIRLKSTRNMQDAANALQWHIYEGLCDNLSESIDIVNLMPLGSFPQYFTDPFVKRQKFSVRNSKFFNIGFCNIKFIRKLFMPCAVERELKRYIKQNKDLKCVLVYTMNNAFLRSLYSLKKQKKDLKICVVVADLPELSSLSSKIGRFEKTYTKVSAKKVYRYASCVDGYVLLTKQMADYMNVEKPFCVIEGISTVTKSERSVTLSETRHKTILYTGTLHRKFGVLNLLAAFSLITNPDYRLVICGVGDSMKEIKYAAERDPRIQFEGQVTREKALELQREATVLINPRQNNEEFTKYSFPSKNLEYLSSGTPLVAYKLDGIPDEYDEYINYVADDSVDSLANKIMEICELPREARYEIGRKARSFVIEEKNAKRQTKKILDLLESL